jgi:hypothetical protein
MNKNSGISQKNLRTKNMLESKKDLKDHKYGAAHRRMREAKKGMLTVLFSWMLLSHISTR